MRNSSRKRQREQTESKMEEQSSSSKSRTEERISREERTKKRKILTERKRRERMDESYRSLERILLTSGFFKKERENDASVEKAIILEQSVLYIQNLQNELKRLQRPAYKENRVPIISAVASPSSNQGAFKMFNHSTPIFNPVLDGSEFNYHHQSFTSLPSSFNSGRPFSQPPNVFPRFSTPHFNQYSGFSDNNFGLNAGGVSPINPMFMGYSTNLAYRGHHTPNKGLSFQHSTPISDRTASSEKSSSGLGTSSSSSESLRVSLMSSATDNSRVLSNTFSTKAIVKELDLKDNKEDEMKKDKNKNKKDHNKDDDDDEDDEDDEDDDQIDPVSVDSKATSIWNPYF